MIRKHLAIVAACLYGVSALAASTPTREEIANVPMPPGFKIVSTELEGPVFADPAGKTLYMWPYYFSNASSNSAGDRKGQSTCTDKVITVTAGIEAPFPPNLILPELDKRQSCVAEWPPAYAAETAKPVGDWTIITRQDGRKQWAFGGQAAYTSVLDQQPGDTLGGTSKNRIGNAGRAPRRYTLDAPAVAPPGFKVLSTAMGRLVVTDSRHAVYASTRDKPNKTNCYADCTLTWKPILAPATAQPQGEWTVFEREPGVLQWAFRKQPLYTYVADVRLPAVHGAELGEWRNVYTQAGPAAPDGFTVQASETGDVLADKNGKTIYVYNCIDDSADGQSCDTPDSPQAYRLAICGGGDAERCVKNFPYVEAASNAKIPSRTWSIISIDPMTGHKAETGGLRVWAYRGRPVYTFSGDQAPGDIGAMNRGEWFGAQNGYYAFILRDYFFDQAL